MKKILFRLFMLILSCFIASPWCMAEDLRIAVLEFENNTGLPEKEHLRKGLRDFFVTDMQQIADFSLIERSRINDVLKEVQLTESKYFDQTTAAKVGKLMGATYVLTGSYFCLNQKWRMDVRLVKVESGEIFFSDKKDGTEEDVFDMEKELISSIATKLKPTISRKELRKINQIETSNYNSFDNYSRAIYIGERGNPGEAVKILEKISETDKNFSLADRALVEFRKSLSDEISASLKRQADEKNQAMARFMETYAGELRIAQQKGKTPADFASRAILPLYQSILWEQSYVAYLKPTEKQRQAQELIQKDNAIIRKMNEESAQNLNDFWFDFISEPRTSDFCITFMQEYRKKLETLVNLLYVKDENGNVKLNQRLNETSLILRDGLEYGRVSNQHPYLVHYAKTFNFWNSFYPWTPLFTVETKYVASFYNSTPNREYVVVVGCDKNYDTYDDTRLLRTITVFGFLFDHPEFQISKQTFGEMISCLKAELRNFSYLTFGPPYNLKTAEKILPILNALSQAKYLTEDDRLFFKKQALNTVDFIQLRREHNFIAKELRIDINSLSESQFKALNGDDFKEWLKCREELLNPEKKKKQQPRKSETVSMHDLLMKSNK